MKKILFAIIAISFISCVENDASVDYVVFSGTIENLDGGKISIRNSEKIIKDIQVLANGTFSDTIHDIKTGYYSFKYANETSALYLKPGYNLQLTLNTKEFDETVQYSGEGSLENNYLAQKFLNHEGLEKLVSYQYLGTLNEVDYIHNADSIKQLKTAFLKKQKDLDSNFKTLEEVDITYSWATMLKRHVLYRRYVSKEEGYNASADFSNFEKDLDLENADLLEIGSYKNFLNEYYSQKANKISEEEKKEHDITFLKVVSAEVKTPEVKNFLLFGSAKYGISYTKDLQGYYDVFMANTTNEKHKKDITEKYNKLINLSEGKPSPKFTNYENFNGGTTSLDDLKGKYVYVDVWATWCGPCKREIPFLKEIEKKHHGKNIAFVSMSIDKKNDYKKWRAMVTEKELSGVQLFAPEDWSSSFVTNYGIQGIPRFILIDPEGNIINANAPRPSSEELEKKLIALGI